MTTHGHGAVSWDITLPLFSRHMIGQWTMAVVATAVVAGVLMGSIFVATGEGQDLPSMVVIIGGICLGLWLLGLLVMAVVFRGRYQVRYTLSDTGVRLTMTDKVARAASRVAIAGGALAGSLPTAGAGLVAASRESVELLWTGSFRAVFQDRQQCIALRNAWRTLMYVQCAPENYEAVATAIRDYMARHETARRAEGQSPRSVYLGRSLLVLGACIPLFPLASEFDTSVFVPILILCFGLAMVWMINLFGWVVIGGVVAEAILVVRSLLEVRESVLRPGTSYRAYDSLGSHDVSLLAIAGLGAAVLLWLSIAALRQRWLAALLQGTRDAGG